MENRQRKSPLRVRLRVTAARRRAWLHAFKPPRPDPAGPVHKLALREIGGGYRRSPRPAVVASSSSAAAFPEKLRNIQLQEEFDTYDEEAPFLDQTPFLWKRSRIIEIIGAKDIIITLAYSGLCAAFNRTTNKLICYLNMTSDEAIRSLFYNKINGSLITVSVYSSDRFSSLKCRTIPIEYIKRGCLDGGFPLFETESLRWPGFVEFDDVNGKVLTYSAQDGTYKVFDMKNYDFLYSICDKNIQEIKISPGMMLLIYHRMPSYVPLTILSIVDGAKLKTFNHLLHRNRKVDFIEQFNEKLIVKQENENLQIVDVRSFDVIEVNKTKFLTPSAFIFLYDKYRFLTFRDRIVEVWNFRGELVTTFEDHVLWHPNCSTNNIFVTSDQDLIISYCRADLRVRDEDDNMREGSINMSHIFSGKCIAKISPLDPALKIAPRKRGDLCRSTVQSSIREALDDITALFYDEGRNEIYTGNHQGLVHVWSN